MSTAPASTLPTSLQRPAPANPNPAFYLSLLLLAALSVLLHARGLAAMPMLSEEAINLSTAHHPYPIFPWLVAHVHLMKDPLLAARLLSVLAGACLVPLSALVWLNLGQLLRPGTPSPNTLALVTAVLIVACPYLSRTQRIATEDALFLAESMAVAWLSLSLVFASDARAVIVRLIPLTLLLLAAVFTHPMPALTLTILPIGAQIALDLTGPGPVDRRKRALPYIYSILILVMIFALIHPTLVADIGPHASAKMLTNLHTLFVPTAEGILTTQGNLDTGWFFAGLTPPIFIAAMLALPWLLLRRQQP